MVEPRAAEGRIGMHNFSEVGLILRTFWTMGHMSININLM